MLRNQPFEALAVDRFSSGIGEEPRIPWNTYRGLGYGCAAARGMEMPEPMTDRAARERQAYDEGAVWTANDRLHRRFAHVFSGPNSVRAEELFAARLADWSKGADVLDYGCWQGHLAGRIAALGARSGTGIDISGESIALARLAHGDRVAFHVMDGSKMTFPDASFDLVVGRAILHHLDFDRALGEIHRVLRPGGRALFIEPLLGNPAARLFRTLTPKARTHDERPLSRAQITGADRVFLAVLWKSLFCNWFSQGQIPKTAADRAGNHGQDRSRFCASGA